MRHRATSVGPAICLEGLPAPAGTDVGCLRGRRIGTLEPKVAPPFLLVGHDAKGSPPHLPEGGCCKSLSALAGNRLHKHMAFPHREHLPAPSLHPLIHPLIHLLKRTGSRHKPLGESQQQHNHLDTAVVYLPGMSRETISIHLAERPEGDIIPGKTFSEKREPAPTAADLKDGQILVEALYLSLDPAMRGWLRGTHTRPHAQPHSPLFRPVRGGGGGGAGGGGAGGGGG